MPMLVATDREVVVVDVERSTSASVQGIGDCPTCLAADSHVESYRDRRRTVDVCYATAACS
jgi:hypothetical protein